MTLLRSNEELAHENPEGPIIDRTIVALVEDNLWCDIFRSSTEGPGATSLWHELREPEIHLIIKFVGDMSGGGKFSNVT